MLDPNKTLETFAAYDEQIAELRAENANLKRILGAALDDYYEEQVGWVEDARTALGIAEPRPSEQIAELKRQLASVSALIPLIKQGHPGLVITERLEAILAGGKAWP